ncbi:MAG: hypothetical protein KIT63_02545 [Rhodoferax sp.]|nr:hypothetical protein [Rhodoferax sp.]
MNFQEYLARTDAEFARLRPIMEAMPVGGKNFEKLRIGETKQHQLYFAPFSYVNTDAKLVIVGITPGPRQLELAIAAVQRFRTQPSESVLQEIKRLASFGSSSMRPNLLKMLAHFDVRKRLKVGTEEDLWDSARRLLHMTSVVSHATFELKADGTEKPFNGKFVEVLRSPLLRECFESNFVLVVENMNPGAVWIGLGPTPKAALDWCVAKGLLRLEQVGAFSHPSGSGGSQVRYYLRQMSRSEFKEKDPVLKRCDWLDAAYDETRRAFNASLPLS